METEGQSSLSRANAVLGAVADGKGSSTGTAALIINIILLMSAWNHELLVLHRSVDQPTARTEQTATTVVQGITTCSSYGPRPV